MYTNLLVATQTVSRSIVACTLLVYSTNLLVATQTVSRSISAGTLLVYSTYLLVATQTVSRFILAGTVRPAGQLYSTLPSIGIPPDV